MADPTLATLATFADPTAWRVIRGVPVFDEHDEYDADGKLVRRFGRKELEAIAARCNRRERSTGDLSPIGYGHTLPQTTTPETQQPEPIGYGRNWTVGTFGPQGKLAVLVDFYLKPDCYDEALTYPRRSVELWFKDGIIDWIALLRRTPQRDLGLLTDFAGANETDILPRYLTPKPEGEPAAYERRGLKLVYAMESPMPEEVKAEPKEDVTQDRESEEPKGEGEHEELAEKVMGHFLKHPMMQYLAKCYEAHTMGGGMMGMGAAPAAVGATNGAMPDPTRVDRAGEGYARDGDPARYAKLERDLADVKKTNESLAGRLNDVLGRYQKKEREVQLRDLLRDGYQLDVEEELRDTQNLNDDAFGKHLAKIVRHYQKDPAGGQWVDVADRAPGAKLDPNAPMSREQLNQALQYQREQGCDWETAARYAKTGAPATNGTK